MTTATKRKAAEEEERAEADDGGSTGEKRLKLEEPPAVDASLTSAPSDSAIVDGDGDDPSPAPSSSSSLPAVCPYLDTIERRLLDFDFDRVCSVSLSNLNVYACLVCGRYFQGRGKSSIAFFHSVNTSHHVFIHLHTQRIYSLPDGYEVHDPSLHDIQYNLHPTYSPHDISALSTFRTSRGLDGVDYIVGLMGLNNIQRNDWLNVVVQALFRVHPLRNHLLLAPSSPSSSSSSSVRSSSSPSVLLPYFRELVCKMANPRAFRGHVSPHELIQAVTTASDRQFRLGVQSDPLHFLSFFLNRLHLEMGGEVGGGKGKGRKRGQQQSHAAQSIISRCFQGEVKVMTTKRRLKPGERKEEEEADDLGLDFDDVDPSSLIHSTSYLPFFYLSLKLPSAPLFKDAQQQTILPQIPLYDLLAKFNGHTLTYPTPHTRTRYALTHLPRYLIIHYQRFTDNAFFTEKNPTLVTFPLKGLDLRDLLDREGEGGEGVRREVGGMGVRELMEEARRGGVDVEGVVEVEELRERVRQARGGTLYDLICNVVHEGDAKAGKYRIHVLHAPNGVWYEIEDLRVSTSETIAQIVGLSEAYIQVYERRQ